MIKNEHPVSKLWSEQSDCLWDRILRVSVTKGYDYRCSVTCSVEGMVNNFETRDSP